MVLYLGNVGELFLIDLERVCYFQADDHYAHVYYDNNAHFLIPFGLSKVEDTIRHCVGSSSGLVRTGRKYILNLRKVFYINLLRCEVQLTCIQGKHYLVNLSKSSIKTLMEEVKAVNRREQGNN